MRVRAFTQDDAHIFCTEEQIMEEVLEVNDLILSIYEDFGFDDVDVKLSTRPEKRVGSDEAWDKAEGRAEGGARRSSAAGLKTAATRAKAPSTARNSNTRCATRSAANGNAARAGRLQHAGPLRRLLHRRDSKR